MNRWRDYYIGPHHIAVNLDQISPQERNRLVVRMRGLLGAYTTS